MRPSCRPEISLDPEVKLLLSDGIPDTAARGKMRRLWNLSEPEDPAMEGPRRFFLAGGHGHLDMVNGGDGQEFLMSGG